MRTHIEAVESRRLLTATVTGATYVDTWGNGTFDTGYDHELAGSTAYFDLNHDGKYQSTEPHGVTNAGGQYSITDSRLSSGKTYALGFVLPSGYHLYAGDKTFNTTLYASTSSLGGYSAFQYAKVNITNFLDVNKNGKHDAGEPTIKLRRFFEDLNYSGHYDVGEQATGYGGGTLTYKPGFRNLTVDFPFPMDAYVSTTGIGLGQINSGQTINIDYGDYYPARYSGYVYQDKNKNGKMDAGEGVAGRQVYADNDNNGRPNIGDNLAVTDANGYYVVGLSPGTTYLRQVLATDWTGSGSQKVYVAGSTTAISTGHNFTTQPSPTPTTGSISGYLFLDANKNGKQDSGENQYKVPDDTWEQGRIFIDLNHNGYLDNDELDQMEANPDGTFKFTGLLPGSYWVQPYAGFGTLDSTSAAVKVTVTAGKTATASFGVYHYTPVNVWAFDDKDGDHQWSGGDVETPDATVYADLNNNGKLDAGEPSTAAHNVYNPDPGGTLDLPDGTYAFRELLPPGYHQTGYGTNFLGTATTFLKDGVLRLPADNPYHSDLLNLFFLAMPDAVVTGTVFNDNNGNGKKDAGDTTTGNGGVVYADANNNGKLDSGEANIKPNSDGTFALSVKPGSYVIRQALDSGWSQTVASGTAVTIGQTTRSVSGVLFGRKPAATAKKFFTVYGLAIVDDNKDGKYEELEGQNGETFSWYVYVDSNKNGDVDDDDIGVSSVDGQGRWSFQLPADGKTYRVLLRNESSRKFTTASYYDVSRTTDGAQKNLFFGLAP